MKYGILLVVLHICAAVRAQVSLSPLFTDNMVLQQQSEATLWGKTQAGKTVEVYTSWNGKTQKTKANDDGHFRVIIKTPHAGGPYSITVSDGVATKIDNVMIGDVWLCSGQSNMEFPVDGWGKVVNYKQEVENANFPHIRLLRVDNKMSSLPESTFGAVDGGWQICSPETVSGFSAVGYMFGRELLKSQHIPIGLIQSTWGGTPAEAWTSAEALGLMPDFACEVKRIQSMPYAEDDRMKFYENELKRWEEKLEEIQMVQGYCVRDFLQVGFDDSSWDTVKQPGYLTSGEYESFDGIIWVRKVIDIPDSWKGRDLTLKLGKIDDNDITYFNGTVVGRSDGYAEDRKYTVPASIVNTNQIVITVRITDIGGWSGIVGQNDTIPLTLVCEGDDPIILNGEWRARKTLSLNDIPPIPRNPVRDAKNVSMLYNAMINPLVSYNIKGVVWYQGEDNANRAYQYRELLPLMITDWRKHWGYDFDFYIMELANYRERDSLPQSSKWAEMREAQQTTGRIMKNSGSACIIDIGDANDIHPRNKQEAARRLALVARAKTYKENVEYSGPILNDIKCNGRHVILSFSHDKGLKTNDGEKVKGFSVAGLDHKFHWADATIKDGKVIVSSENVAMPVAVRYNWSDNPDGNIYNEDGLPMVSFRTDDWHELTYGNKSY